VIESGTFAFGLAIDNRSSWPKDRDQQLQSGGGPIEQLDDPFEGGADLGGRLSVASSPGRSTG